MAIFKKTKEALQAACFQVAFDLPFVTRNCEEVRPIMGIYIFRNRDFQNKPLIYNALMPCIALLLRHLPYFSAIDEDAKQTEEFFSRDEPLL
jgi:hypothetical protein